LLGPWWRVLLHDHTCGHGVTRGFLYAAEKKTRYLQSLLRLGVAETDQVWNPLGLWSRADREEDLRTLLRLPPAGGRLLEHLAGVFLSAFLKLDVHPETRFGEALPCLLLG
jgi:hypothetical protein